MIQSPESTSDAEVEGDIFIIALGMDNGSITERWSGWVTCGGQPVVAVCFGAEIGQKFTCWLTVH